jgi:hypothetical protein
MTLSSFSSLVEPLRTTPMAFDLLIPGERKAIHDYETDTQNTTGSRIGKEYYRNFQATPRIDCRQN